MFHPRRQGDFPDATRSSPDSGGDVTGCRIGEHIAAPPVDASGAGTDLDGGPAADATTCDPGGDGDGDGVADCVERDDGDAFTDQVVFNGLHAIIGETPEVTGNCSALDDRAELDDRFDPAVAAQDVRAGWELDTGADSYADPSYGFSPNWASAVFWYFNIFEQARLAALRRRRLHAERGDHARHGPGAIAPRGAYFWVLASTSRPRARSRAASRT